MNQAKVEEDNKQEDGEVRLEECAQHRAYFHIEAVILTLLKNPPVHSALLESMIPLKLKPQI